MYREGKGVTQDYEEAVKWFRQAAEQGFAEGQNNLGWMYQNGLGVTKNVDEAVKWYKKSAEQGLATAKDNLGQMGLGVSPDAVEAVKWYRNLLNKAMLWLRTIWDRCIKKA
jgi:TPR repeat protein